MMVKCILSILSHCRFFHLTSSEIGWIWILNWRRAIREGLIKPNHVQAISDHTMVPQYSSPVSTSEMHLPVIHILSLQCFCNMLAVLKRMAKTSGTYGHTAPWSSYYLFHLFHLLGYFIVLLCSFKEEMSHDLSAKWGVSVFGSNMPLCRTT